MEKVKISELKTNNTISDLVPEMTEKEYLDLKSSIEESGLRHPIDINKDNTILDGRHRVRAYKSLGYESIAVTKHDFSESEAIKFVVDTAVNRRNLTEAQRLNIVLNSEDVIAEIVENNKNRQLSGLKNQNSSLGSVEPNDKIPTNTGEEIGKLAGVSRSTVIRAKKVRKENPEAYQKVVNGESTWSREYDKLPSVKNNKPKPVKEAVPSEKKVSEIKKAPEVEIKQDSRHSINEFYKSNRKRKPSITKNEDIVIEVVNTCLALESALEEVSDKDVFNRYLSTPDHIEVVTRVAKKLIKTIKEV